MNPIINQAIDLLTKFLATAEADATTGQKLREQLKRYDRSLQSGRLTEQQVEPIALKIVATLTGQPEEKLKETAGKERQPAPAPTDVPPLENEVQELRKLTEQLKKII